MDTELPQFDDSSPPPRSKRKLIPYAIALAIILMLAGMLIPSLSAAREKARRASCNCSLKQLGLAFRLYSGDHGDMYPSDASWTVLGSYALLTNNYMTALKTWICPSDNCGPGGCGMFGGKLTVNPFVKTNVGYAYNGFGLSEKVQPDTPIAGDRTSADIRSSEPYRGNTRTHKEDGGNLLYADGHVEWRKKLIPPMYNGKNP